MGTFTDVNSIKSFPIKKYAVVVKNVSKTYDGCSEPVLRNISMNVQEGIVYGLLGSSGCGKTSLLSCIVGLKRWDSGDIVVMGKKVDQENGINARDIGYMPQDVALYEQLKVTEMLRYYAKLYNMSKEKFQKQISLLQELLNLPGYGSRCISSLSGGQKRRISLAVTLIHSPKLLILDEPTVGLDPLLRENIWQYLYNLTYTNNTTIIITTHYIEEVKNSNMIGVMRKGALLVEEDPVALMHAYQTSILEEVVLKICRVDRNNRRKSFETQRKNRLSSNGSLALEDLESVKVSKEDKQLCKWFQKTAKLNMDSHENHKEIKNGNTKDVLDDNEKNLTKSVTSSIKRTLSFSQVVCTNFFRSPIFIGLVLLLPPFQLFSTGIVLGVEPKYTPFGIVNHEIPDWKDTCFEKEKTILTMQHDDSVNGSCDLSKLSCDLIKHFTKGIYLDAVQYTNVEDARFAVTRGTIRGYIEIPDNYSSHVVERAVTRMFADIETVNGTTTLIHMDMSEFVTVYVVLTELFRSFGDFVKDITSDCNFDLKLIEIPFAYREPVFGSLDGTARDYALPALIAGILFEVSFCVTPLIFITDYKLGTLERSNVAGLKFPEMMMGLSLTITSLAVVQAAICYISLQYGLGFEILGSIFAYVCVCLMTVFCGGAFGLLVGVMYKDEFMVVISAIFLIPLLMIYAGILRPIEIIPHPFRSLIFYFFPCAAIVKPFRFIMNRGVSLTHPMVWPGILVTFVWGTFFFSACLIVFRRMKR